MSYSKANKCEVGAAVKPNHKEIVFLKKSQSVESRELISKGTIMST